MRVCFFHSDKPRERILADAWREGVLRAGDEFEARPLTGEAQIAEGCDVAVMVGVKSRQLYQANWRAGVHVIMVDKGYTRHAAPGPVKLWEYWRVAVDGHHPTAYLMREPKPHDRFERLGLTIAEARLPDPRGHILIAGSSAKYHEFYGLTDPTKWTGKLVKAIRRTSSRPILYRPKPSWRDAVPIEGTRFSGDGMTLEQSLEGCAVMITHGSNACFEAQLAGVPVITLGEAVSRPICSDVLEHVDCAPIATVAGRRQWAANLAYCQWTMREFASGEAWRNTRGLIYG